YCEGDSINLTGGPGGMATYNWSGPNAFSSSSQSPTIPSATTAMNGTYTLNVTNAAGCWDIDTTDVTVSADPVADAGFDAGFCVGDSVQIGGSPTGSGGAGGYTYSWTPVAGLDDASIANPTVSAANTFTVNVTDANGCWDTDDVIVTETACTALDPAIKSDSLLIDADGGTHGVGAGYYSAGDTILYEVTVWNEGTANATGVVFTDTPDPNTTLVTGSVATSKGSVTTGNNPGDTSISVTVGTILAGGPATETITISFHVRINYPLPFSVHNIYNQGLFTYNEGPPEPTDDPDTDPDDDPTVTPVARGGLLTIIAQLITGLDEVLSHFFIDGEVFSQKGNSTVGALTSILDYGAQFFAILLTTLNDLTE
ncbi:MAG: hypothetical protein MUP73_07590, partial [Dehalococcoidia bacterium]|nr:hypothetical protein [Dehalococcoidia bacterium]